MVSLRLVREASTMNPGPGKKKGWFKSNLVARGQAAPTKPTILPKEGLSCPVVWIHTSFVHPHSQDAPDHHYLPNTLATSRYRTPRPSPTTLPSNSPCSTNTTTGRPAAPPCGTPSVMGGLSISQLNHAYRMTLRPIIVHKGKLVGRGPVYS